MLSTYARPGAIASAMLLIGSIALATEEYHDNSSPLFHVQLPPDYRVWQVIGVAHEAGALNDIRVILGNDVAMKAYRDGKRPFPDGTMIARLAWKYVPSAQNNAIFGQTQSYVAGDPTNVQIDVKNSKAYAATGGWGYAQFENGKVNPSESLVKSCFACHSKLPKSEDLVFTHYAP